MGNSDSVLLGKVTLAAGISASLQVIFLILMFTVARSMFGTISDYFYALTPLLILPLILSLPKLMGVENAGIALIVMILGIAGVLIASAGQILLLLKRIDFKQSVWGNSVGLGLIGLAFLALALLTRGNPGLPAGFNWFGIILGTAMAIGIPAGLFYLDELIAVEKGTLVWAETSPLIYPVVLAGVLTQIGLPVWLIWTAQLLLSGRLTFIS
jgi:hypothetical protein